MALTHGADLESLLDLLALLAAGKQSSERPNLSVGGGGRQEEAEEGGDGGLCLLPAHWSGRVVAAWYRCLEQAGFTVAAAAQWQQQQGQEQERERKEGREAPQPPFPAAALAPATLAECRGRLAVLASGAWRAEAEGLGGEGKRWAEEMRLDLGNLGAWGGVGCMWLIQGASFRVVILFLI